MAAGVKTAAWVEMDDPGTIAVKMIGDGSEVGRMTRRNAEAAADRMRDLAPSASGNLRSNIRVEQARTLGRFSFGFLVIADTPYSRYVNDGRAPGRMPPVDAIRRWTIQKGIDPAAAYPIARAIGQRGTRPTGFIEASLGAVRWSM